MARLSDLVPDKIVGYVAVRPDGTCSGYADKHVTTSLRIVSDGRDEDMHMRVWITCGGCGRVVETERATIEIEPGRGAVAKLTMPYTPVDILAKLDTVVLTEQPNGGATQDDNETAH